MIFFGKLKKRKNAAEKNATSEDESQEPVIEAKAGAQEQYETRTIALDLSEEPGMDAGEAGEQGSLLASVSQVASDAASEQKSINIWDLDDDAATPAPLPQAPVQDAAVAAPSSSRPASSSARRRRNKTRLLGFDQSDGEVVDLFDASPKAVPSKSVKFPVGWVVVVDGPGRGESFTLQAGMSLIGRGEDQAVQLDFGDNAISRTNHAAIVYDPENHTFILGHGGKSNIVRLNEKPLISNENLSNGDLIRLGETTLRFVVLCDSAFNWGSGANEENEDVEIA